MAVVLFFVLILGTLAAMGLAEVGVFMPWFAPEECRVPVPDDESLIFEAARRVASVPTVQVIENQPGQLVFSVGRVLAPTSPADVLRDHPDCCRIELDVSKAGYQPGALMRQQSGPFRAVMVRYDVSYMKEAGERGIQRIEREIIFDRCGKFVNHTG